MSLCPHGVRIEHKRCYACEDIAAAELQQHHIDVNKLYEKCRTGRFKGTGKPNKSNIPRK